jgi:hypothetical protein
LERNLPVESLTLLAPAIRVDEFESGLLRSLAPRSIRQLTIFGLGPERELNDTCGVAGNPFYQKSLLYLISRGLEAPTPAPGRQLGAGAYSGEIPLLGMAKHFEARRLQSRIQQKFPSAAFITAPSEAPQDERTDAIRHGDLEDDSFTMTSVAMRLLGSSQVDPYRTHMPLLGLDHVPGQKLAGMTPAKTADTQPPQAPPVVATAEAGSFVPRVPRCRGGGDPPEIGEAPPGGDRTSATLRMEGYKSSPESRIERLTRATSRTRRRTDA